MSQKRADRFTKFYECFAEWDELDLLEALILSRIRMWGNAGCFESYATIAKKLKLDRRTVIRVVKRLLTRELIWIEYQSRQKRVLKFNVEKFTNMPLFEGKKLVAQRHQPPITGGTETPSGGTETPVLVAQRHPNISYRQLQDIQDTNFLASCLTRQKARPMRDGEFQKRQKEQVSALLKTSK